VSEVRRSAVRGLAWTSLSYGLREAVKFLAGIFVARLLLPRDFGVFALASLAIAVLALVRNLGFAAAIVRDPDLDEAKRSTAFWTNAAVGLALAAVVALAAPSLAAWFGEPRLRLALWVLAPTFLLDSLSAVHDALLERARDYRRRALRDSAATLLGTAVALGLAFAGAGWLALVLQRVVAGAASAVFLWSAVAWRPTLAFDRAALSGLLGFGLPLAGWTAMTWLTNNVDSLLVGRLLGPVALGTYALAYSVARGPGQLVQAVLGGVLFPELSRIQHDLPQVRQVYVSSLRHILAALLLPLAAMAALAPTFVPLVYGPQWTGAVPLIQLFALVAIVPIATTTAAWIYTSQGRTRRLFWTGAATTALLVAGFLVGLRGGLVGLATAYAIVSVVVGLPVSLLAGRLVGLHPVALGRAVAAPVVAWLEALAVFAIVQAAWPEGGWWTLALATGLATPAYLLVLQLLDPGLLGSLRRLRRDLRGKRGNPPGGAWSQASVPPMPAIAPGGASATLETSGALAGPATPAVPQVVRFRLGHAPDIGWLAGLPGITPLQLHGDLFTARVADPRTALGELQKVGFPAARLDDEGDDPRPPINV
jgi:O-antigen/teichoic acid export membrane protein